MDEQQIKDALNAATMDQLTDEIFSRHEAVVIRTQHIPSRPRSNTERIYGTFTHGVSSSVVGLATGLLDYLRFGTRSSGVACEEDGDPLNEESDEE